MENRRALMIKVKLKKNIQNFTVRNIKYFSNTKKFVIAIEIKHLHAWVENKEIKSIKIK